MLRRWIEGETPTRRRALLLLVLSAVLWSFAGLLIKRIEWHPLAISGMRSIVGAVVMWAAFRKFRFTWSSPQIGGAIAYAGTVILFVVANKMTTAANAILLQYTAPIHVALFGGWFLGEKTVRRDWGIIFLVLVGMTLFFFDRLTASGFLGNVIALGSGACFGWLTLFLRKQKSGSPVESVFLGNVLAGLIGIPFMFGAGPRPDAIGWVALLLLGSFQLALPYVIYSLAIRHVTAVEAMLVPVIEPVLNPIWVLLLIGEIPGPLSILGGTIILGSIVFRGLRTDASAPDPAHAGPSATGRRPR